MTRVYADEYYPYFAICEDDDDDWLPIITLTPEELADYQRVQAEWKAWQRRLAEVHR